MAFCSTVGHAIFQTARAIGPSTIDAIEAAAGGDRPAPLARLVFQASWPPRIQWRLQRPMTRWWGVPRSGIILEAGDRQMSVDANR